MVLAREPCDALENLLVVAQHFGDRRLGPDEQVGFIRQRLSGKPEQFVKAFRVVFRIPNERLGNARLNQRHLDFPRGRRCVGDVIKSPGKSDCHGEHRKNHFAQPDRAHPRSAQHRRRCAKQRRRRPHHEKRHAINARHGRYLNQRPHSKLRSAEQVPGKSPEQPHHNHFQRDPACRAVNGPEHPPTPGHRGDLLKGSQPFCSGRRQTRNSKLETRNFQRQPDPRRGKQRQIRAQRQPAKRRAERQAVPAIRNEQQPVKRREIMRQPGDVAETEAFHAAAAERGGEHQCWCDPGEAGDANFWKRRRQQNSCDDGQRETALDEFSGRNFQPAQLALKIFKNKFSPEGLARNAPAGLPQFSA